MRRGAPAGPNPWDAPGLEWATSSPPPVYGHPHIPVAEGRTPLWQERGTLPVMQGLRVDERERATFPSYERFHVFDPHGNRVEILMAD